MTQFTLTTDEITVLNSIAMAHYWLSWDGVIRAVKSEMIFIADCQEKHPQYNWLEMMNENRSNVRKDAHYYLLPEKAESLQEKEADLWEEYKAHFAYDFFAHGCAPVSFEDWKNGFQPVEKKEEAQTMTTTNQPTPREMVEDAINYILDTDRMLDLTDSHGAADITPNDVQIVLKDAFRVQMTTGEISDIMYDIEHPA